MINLNDLAVTEASTQHAILIGTQEKTIAGTWAGYKQGLSGWSQTSLTVAIEYGAASHNSTTKNLQRKLKKWTKTYINNLDNYEDSEQIFKE